MKIFQNRAMVGVWKAAADTLGGNEVSDIELYGYKKDAKYIVKIEL